MLHLIFSTFRTHSEHFGTNIELFAFAALGGAGVVVGIIWNILDSRRSEPRCNS